jgi:mevalonate pyrophosphate decarboxylase
VTDQFYFATIAGIALSAAGFAGLVTALRGDGQHWSRTELWRLRNIVQSSLAITRASHTALHGRR